MRSVPRLWLPRECPPVSVGTLKPDNRFRSEQTIGSDLNAPRKSVMRLRQLTTPLWFPTAGCSSYNDYRLHRFRADSELGLERANRFQHTLLEWCVWRLGERIEEGLEIDVMHEGNFGVSDGDRKLVLNPECDSG